MRIPQAMPHKSANASPIAWADSMDRYGTTPDAYGIHTDAVHSCAVLNVVQTCTYATGALIGYDLAGVSLRNRGSSSP